MEEVAQRAELVDKERRKAEKEEKEVTKQAEVGEGKKQMIGEGRAVAVDTQEAPSFSLLLSASTISSPEWAVVWSRGGRYWLY